MSPRHAFVALLLASALVVSVSATVAGAQSPAPASQPQAPAVSQSGTGAGPGAGAVPADSAGIDQILQGEELLLSDTGYNYDPGNRRDPFRSLLAGDTRQITTGPRAEGPAGMLIDEILLSGIFRTSQGWVAQVLASNKGKSYLIKEGDQLLDGDVVSIGRSEVVFKQIVSDPTVIKPFREVVKKLNP